MIETDIQDGTWTQRAPNRKNGVWRVWISEPWVTDLRFRQARFVLEGGPTILVSAQDLQKVVAGTKQRGKIAVPLRIDPQKSTINGQTIELTTVA